MSKRRSKNRRPLPRRRWTTSRILTWIGLVSLGAAILVVGLLAFTGGDEAPRRAVRQQPVVSEAQAVTVKVVDNDFEPRHLTVRPGTEVTWKFEGDAAHDVTDDRGAFTSGTMTEGDEFVMTFDEPGTYYYYCTLHHAMQGTLVVAP